MKYYGEKTKKLYDTAEACQQAEFEAKEAENRAKILKEREEREKKERAEALAAERKSRAAEVEKARKDMVKAQQAYRELLELFIKDYHSYHFTWTDADDFPCLFDFLNFLH